MAVTAVNVALNGAIVHRAKRAMNPKTLKHRQQLPRSVTTMSVQRTLKREQQPHPQPPCAAACHVCSHSPWCCLT
jgi:hypothetical protein